MRSTDALAAERIAGHNVALRCFLLRLLLACGHVASEEAGLEMLAYEFFEQVRQCWQPCHCYRPLGGTRCVTNHAM